jgi:hypothetical protein
VLVLVPAGTRGGLILGAASLCSGFARL